MILSKITKKAQNDKKVCPIFIFCNRPNLIFSKFRKEFLIENAFASFLICKILIKIGSHLCKKSQNSKNIAIVNSYNFAAKKLLI